MKLQDYWQQFHYKTYKETEHYLPNKYDRQFSVYHQKPLIRKHASTRQLTPKTKPSRILLSPFLWTLVQRRWRTASIRYAEKPSANRGEIWDEKSWRANLWRSNNGARPAFITHKQWSRFAKVRFKRRERGLVSEELSFYNPEKVCPQQKTPVLCVCVFLFVVLSRFGESNSAENAIDCVLV